MKRITLVLCALSLITLQSYAQSKADEANYTNGVFIVNEDWYGHQNSTVNWLSNEGEWTSRVFQKENPDHELGCTTQFGTIYGDNFYFVSKQDRDPGASVTGARFSVCDAKTMKIKKTFQYIATQNGDNNTIESIADGRSFLGVNEHKGYIGTSNGIWLFDIDNLKIGSQIEGTGNPSEDGYGKLYYAQIGNMLRKDEFVYAVHQQYGLQIINPETDQIVRTIQAPIDGDKQRGFGSIIMSKDGNIWLSVAQDQTGGGATAPYLLKLDPTTQDTTRIHIPTGINAPANSWYAWTADGFCSSKQHNRIYWNGGTNSWFSNSNIYCYDIDSNEFSQILNLTDTEWKLYGAAFRVHPVTDELYCFYYHDFIDPTHVLTRLSNKGEELQQYSMIENFWFPAMPVFPDNEPPVIAEIEKIRNNYTPFIIPLSDIVTDADNMEAAIVKSIVSISNEDILSANITNGNLSVTPKGVEGDADITIKFNSNGKVAQSTISINLSPGNPDKIDSEQVLRSAYYNDRQLYINNCDAFNFTLYNMNGQNIETFHVNSNTFSIPVNKPNGIYILKGSNGKDNIILKVIIK